MDDDRTTSARLVLDLQLTASQTTAFYAKLQRVNSLASLFALL